MDTLLPPTATPEPSPGAPDGRGGVPPGPAPGGGLGAGAAAVVVAVLALVVASVAVVFVGNGDGSTAAGGGAGSAGGGSATIELTEFALSPAAVTVDAGGSLEVTNSGSVAHNLSIDGTDIATADLAAGDSETLDLSSLEPGEYGITCTIAGHADAGMTGTLTVTEAGRAAAGGSAPAGDGAAAATGEAATGDTGGGDGGGAHAGHEMTEAEYAEMTEAMNETVEAFPAETEGEGNQVLEPTIGADGVKEFELTAAVTRWETEPGVTVDAWAYNGMVPGPQIRLDVGDRVRIVLHNELPMGTDLHLHGIDVDNAMDGVAPITQPVIEPGDSFAYEFVAEDVSVSMYHAHHHGHRQVSDGLFGTILVGDLPLPTGRTVSGVAIPEEVTLAQELPMVLNDSGAIGYSLNGKSFPATAPIVAEQGDWVLLHYYNQGSQPHPMHLHEFEQVVVAKDGFPVDHPYAADTVNVAPGERYSVLVRFDKPGTWVWHCHILDHVERDEGMYGMVTAVVVN